MHFSGFECGRCSEIYFALYLEYVSVLESLDNFKYWQPCRKLSFRRFKMNSSV